ncbi:MAG: diaminopimelate epimerase [Wenyingzhuangia sp.]|uniref:diaminopimelate epimerase n=1 Tax=Wenyingzhuangia sp. TaxID=1964193 RepID=UPI00321A934F
MEITFYKYQGTGNDFVVIDNRDLSFPRENKNLVSFLCNRRFGIGADGLMLLNPSNSSDFTMVYYNADGSESTMCGNGGRCLVAFAHLLGLFEEETTFDAIDGLHYASYKNGITNLQMIDVDDVDVYKDHCFLNTGSPHHVQLIENIEAYDVKSNGSKIRYGAPYFKVGTNVNFVEPLDNNKFRVRTYERGVEAETLACGTGVTAVAIAMYEQKKTTQTTIPLQVEGGELEVSFEPTENGYQNIFLKGPATFVFKGNIIYNE